MKRLSLAIIALFSAAECVSATLSLTSTNDYRYVIFPSDMTIDVRGLGAGEYGLYRVPRREDVTFIVEAMFERGQVAREVMTDATEVFPLVNTYTNYLSGVPSSAQKEGIPELGWMEGGLFSTNDITIYTGRIVKPINLKRGAWTLLDRGQDYLDRNMITNLFTDGHTPSEITLVTTLRNSKWPRSVFLGPYALHFGYVTNVYHDIKANTAVTFAQTARTSGGGTVITKEEKYDPHELYGMYDKRTRQWMVSMEFEDRTSISSNSNPYVKYGPLYDDCVERRSMYKYSRAAFTNTIEYVSRLRERLASRYEYTRSHTPNITLPKFSNGSTLTNMIAASAVIWYQHLVRDGTNYYHNISKILVMPTTLRRSGETSEGYPAFKDNATTEDYIALCKRRDVIPDTDFSDEQLYSMFEYPDYPTVTRPYDGYKSNQSSLIEEIRTSVICYVGLADILFNARVLSDP